MVVGRPLLMTIKISLLTAIPQGVANNHVTPLLHCVLRGTASVANRGQQQPDQIMVSGVQKRVCPSKYPKPCMRRQRALQKLLLLTGRAWQALKTKKKKKKKKNH